MIHYLVSADWCEESWLLACKANNEQDALAQWSKIFPNRIRHNPEVYNCEHHNPGYNLEYWHKIYNKPNHQLVLPPYPYDW